MDAYGDGGGGVLRGCNLRTCETSWLHSGRKGASAKALQSPTAPKLSECGKSELLTPFSPTNRVPMIQLQTAQLRVIGALYTQYTYPLYSPIIPILPRSTAFYPSDSALRRGRGKCPFTRVSQVTETPGAPVSTRPGVT